MKNKISESSASLGAQIMVASELGSSIIVCSIAGYFAGSWADQVLHSSPLGTAFGIFIGFGLSIVYVVRRSNQISEGRVSRLDIADDTQDGHSDQE